MSKSICIVSLHTPNLAPLADITWDRNKKLYCDRHGYDFRLRVQERSYPVSVAAKKPSGETEWPYAGFDKILFLEEVLNENAHDWLMWLDCDTLITNLSTKIESVIEANFDRDFLFCGDSSNINAGVILIKNSEKSRRYIEHLKRRMFELASHNEFLFGEEQTALIDSYAKPEYADTIRVLPQKVMNSYPYSGVYGHPAGRLDILGFNGNWTKGDFVLHIPGFGPDLFHLRMEHFNRYIEEVI